MGSVKKLKGYEGHVKIDENGEIEESSNIENLSKLVELIKFNLKKGNEEAKQLGFNKLNGFAMFGSNKSLTFMKGLAIVVDNDKADWQDLFTYYTYNKTFIITGGVLVLLSILLFYYGLLTPMFNFMAPEPRIYIPTILLLIGVIFLILSKSTFSYRLE
ncbi:hypothetical protein SULI_02270 [Saccharolobus solfataricus]|uniref:NUMOD4 domain protein n=3 Tax=Saccharolobus solfataricus TaxID=2287 RepID=Q97VI2_SACS2|nr:hypothetical protein [Saccharolobus solfataricus]AAK42762.1 Hypothetical protein SSO2641 [Saccharolobus solfataricus P2]AKA72856.1 hypothetical protein SULB_0447 [Saccharolobus solfataricus]AKA75554.1 hypothetical protein SULC_0445 [Saccharolobus solfataricus]AKA78248.1 hypothetical protein SULA_0445 [Saccharolobus solfataricus]AZF67366.1 hypothetical protein SULG_02270 [Saccharolobus solfataricus]